MQLFAALIDAVTTTDDLQAHVGLRDIVAERARRIATSGGSFTFARAEIEAATLPMLIDAGLDPRAMPARVRAVETQIDRWIADCFPSMADHLSGTR